jgi:hypothetical protein
MTWSDFYLLCFLVGFSLSVLSFLAGAVHIHLPVKMHFPFHGGHFGGHAGGGHIGGHAVGHAGGAGHAPSHGSGATGKGAQDGSGHLSWFNATTIMAFLAWFGGVGYILSTRSNGIGEVIFEQNGSRRSVSARCDGGKAVALGAEVVIERYENGIAYVQLWEEFTK